MNKKRILLTALLAFGLLGTSLVYVGCFPDLPSMEGVPCLFTSECQNNLVCVDYLCVRPGTTPRDASAANDGSSLPDDIFDNDTTSPGNDATNAEGPEGPSDAGAESQTSEGSTEPTVPEVSKEVAREGTETSG